MRFVIVISMLSLVACAGLLPAGYNQEEELGECLKWRTTIVEKKERLPYPMRGIVVREEQVVQCAIREEIDA
jgi:high-affinity Fe2+/Pb2+ permease